MQFYQRADGRVDRDRVDTTRKLFAKTILDLNWIRNAFPEIVLWGENVELIEKKIVFTVQFEDQTIKY